MRVYTWSSAISLALAGVVAGIANLPDCDSAGLLLLPAALLAALVLPQGIHSDYGFTYMALAAVIDVLSFGVLTAFVLKWIERGGLHRIVAWNRRRL